MENRDHKKVNCINVNKVIKRKEFCEVGFDYLGLSQRMNKGKETVAFREWKSTTNDGFCNTKKY